MTPDSKNPAALVGRFIVESGHQRDIGLTVSQVQTLLAENKESDVTIYRINRVDAAGRMELVGVSALQFSTPEGLVFTRHTESAARADYEAILAASRRRPPPGPIEMELAEIMSGTPVYAVTLIFPAAMAEAVGHWLQNCGLRPGEQVNGGLGALPRYRSSLGHLIEQTML